MRLFIAVKLNSEMKKQISDVQTAFRKRGIGGNYTPSENMHVTLAFIGEYDDPDYVLETMGSVRFNGFTIVLDRIGSFDQLFWAGLTENIELEKLAGNLRHALADADIPFDRKKFKAHITFLRKPENFSAEKIAGITIRPSEMHVSAISLICSTRGRNGMIYTELGSVPAEDCI